MIVNSIYGQTFSLSAVLMFRKFKHHFPYFLTITLGFSFLYNYRKLLVLKYLFDSAETYISNVHILYMQKLCNEDKIQTDCDIFRT